MGDNGFLTRRDAVRTLGAAMFATTLPGAAVQLRGPAMRASRVNDVVIIRGRIVNADGVSTADVRVRDGVIVQVASDLSPADGERVINAEGRLVLPGGIDPHTHLHPGFVDDMTTGSRAALAGGITTVGTFATPQRGEAPLAALERLGTTVAREAIADVILHLAAWPPTQELIDVLPALVERGQPSIKMYMMRTDFDAQLPQVIRVLEAARAAGVVTMLHCENAALLAAAVRRLTAEGRTSLEHYSESRPLLAEILATQQAVALCEDTRAPLYLVHMSSGRALESCVAARAAGLPLYLETRPLFIHLSEEKLRGPDHPLYVGQPPLRPRADVAAMFQGLIEGRIDVLATDHAPWTRSQKLDPALGISRVRPGASDLQFMLPMYFSEGVGKRGLSLTRFVETTSTNAARIFGLYPTKGVIREGADADIAIWDPQLSAPVRAQNDYSNSDYSPYEGWEVQGWPVTVLRRGEVVVADGRVVDDPTRGKLVSRRAWSQR